MDGFADALLLSAHMIEHLVADVVVPPLIALWNACGPIACADCRAFTRGILGPFFRRQDLRRLAHWLVTPLVAWLAMNFRFWHGMCRGRMTLR
jgi:putative membrane protein